ncbi:tRNA glutamyl-Q(34) synthetase GluQRS [Dyella sp. Tek66A03]|uniref:tRNA glutamyl-Q(34) synthetase GluQRS n=1 Tax=Dyella sp. Tek66A03 TaxID=3458298 RepID=UPI00403ECE19
MSYRGRFAPSPTGHLHFGSLVAAVGSWLCARRAGGQWLLRVEDIDPPREMPGSAESILAALPGFGLIADAPALFQSKRSAAYDQAFEQLKAANQVFPCWCSRNDLAGGLHLDGQCLAPAAEDRTPAWRLHVPDLRISFDDALQGRQTQNLRSTAGDFVIRRVEGYYAYQLACVVDDAFQGITQVVRGNDLLDSTPRQIYLQQCLGLPTPDYLHLPLALDAGGRKLSKTEQAHPVDPTDPMPALRHALGFLNLPTPLAIREPAPLLAYALDRFTPKNLPHCSERPANKTL